MSPDIFVSSSSITQRCRTTFFFIFFILFLFFRNRFFFCLLFHLFFFLLFLLFSLFPLFFILLLFLLFFLFLFCVSSVLLKILFACVNNDLFSLLLVGKKVCIPSQKAENRVEKSVDIALLLNN